MRSISWVIRAPRVRALTGVLSLLVPSFAIPRADAFQSGAIHLQRPARFPAFCLLHLRGKRPSLLSGHAAVRLAPPVLLLTMAQRSASSSNSNSQKAPAVKVDKSSPSKQSSAPKDEEELSNRAKFRLTPIDPNVLRKIQQLNLCSPMGKAMRVAHRDLALRKQEEEEKNFRGFSRPPLYNDIPEEIMGFIGESKRNKLTFVAGALTETSLPPEGLPEVAVCGRSNVGKSSIINAVTLSTTARSSDKPGMTQQFNFYQLPRRLMLVDLPGYGFAFADPHKMESWRLLMDRYLQSRKTLKRALLVIDARHGIKSNDREFMDRLELSRTPFQVVMTKCDLTREEDLARRHALVTAELAGYSKALKTVRLISSFTGAGLLELAQDLHALALRLPPKPAAVAAAAAAKEKEQEMQKEMERDAKPDPRRPAAAGPSSQRGRGGGPGRGRGGGESMRAGRPVGAERRAEGRAPRYDDEDNGPRAGYRPSAERGGGGGGRGGGGGGRGGGRGGSAGGRGGRGGGFGR